MWHIEPSCLVGRLTVPPSKSHTLRALLLASFARGKSKICNPLLSPDSHHMMQACKLLGASFQGEGCIEVEGIDGPPRGAAGVLQVGNSGIALRFLTALCAFSSLPIEITGDHSICTQRQMQPLLDALTKLGVNAYSTNHNGYAPLIIQGPVKGKKTEVVGRDSQYVSALLFMGLFTPMDLVVYESGEKPWVEMTLSWLNRLGVKVEREGYERFCLQGEGYEGFSTGVPADVSTLAFPLAAALLTNSSLTLEGIDLDDCQGDKKLIDILIAMGAKIQKGADFLRVEASELTAIEVDVNDCIDALPILAVIASKARGKTRLTNAAVARGKESNRIAVMAKELTAMGVRIHEESQGLCIEESQLMGAKVDAHGDHRVAMALTVAALAAGGDSYLQGGSCCVKTYPNFVTDMQKLGAKIRCC